MKNIFACRFVLFISFIFLNLFCFAEGNQSENKSFTKISGLKSDNDIPNTAYSEKNFYTEYATVGVTRNLVIDYRVNNSDDKDDSNKLQKAINEISTAQNGGKLIIPAGKYYFNAIRLKSNVHIKIDEGAIIYPTDQSDEKNHTVFFIGQDEPLVENVSIVGNGKGFTVDFRKTEDKKLAVFTLGNVQNFKLSNFNIQDNKTIFASILFY